MLKNDEIYNIKDFLHFHAQYFNTENGLHMTCDF